MVYKPKPIEYTYYQICQFAIPNTSNYSIRRLKINENYEFISIKEKEYNKKKIQKFIEKTPENKFSTYPTFNIKSVDIFLKKNYFIETEYIDLNNLSSNYLPKKFDNNEYTRNRPDFKICYIYQFLYTNININSTHVYDFIKFIYDKYNFINKMSIKDGYKITIKPIQTTYINYHEGAIKYFFDYGYYTYNNNENCKYLVGKMKCNDINLKKNNFNI
jgi:hypothetical protein